MKRVNIRFEPPAPAILEGWVYGTPLKVLHFFIPAEIKKKLKVNTAKHIPLCNRDLIFEAYAERQEGHANLPKCKACEKKLNSPKWSRLLVHEESEI